MTRRFTLEEDEAGEQHPGYWARFKDWIRMGGDDEEEDEEPNAPASPRRRGTNLRLQTTRAPRIHRISVRSLADAQQAADLLKERHAVILNLEQTDEDVARRAVDFVSGAAYALDGYYERVGERIFLFTPSNIMITSEEEDQLASSRGLYVNA